MRRKLSVSQGIKLASILILDFPASSIDQNTFLLLKLLSVWYFIMANWWRQIYLTYFLLMVWSLCLDYYFFNCFACGICWKGYSFSSELPLLLCHNSFDIYMCGIIFSALYSVPLIHLSILLLIQCLKLGIVNLWKCSLIHSWLFWVFAFSHKL